MRHKLAWVVHTRPDIACAVYNLAQESQKYFKSKFFQNSKKVLKHLKATSSLSLLFPKLDMRKLRLNVYYNSSFADNADFSSQLGYIVTLCDGSNRCFVLHFASKKSKWVTRSSAAAETLAFAHTFDNAYLIKHDLQTILHKKIPILMLTDSKILFYVLTRSLYTSEKRLMIDIAAARQAYTDGQLDNIALSLNSTQLMALLS